MPSFSSFSLVAFASLLAFVSSDPNAICYSFGVDYLDEGHYFINSELAEKFSTVSYFRGCNQDLADVLLIEPADVSSTEYLCDQIPTFPDNQLMTSTCPIGSSLLQAITEMMVSLSHGRGIYISLLERQVRPQLHQQ
jgi:hypothetical protein